MLFSYPKLGLYLVLLISGFGFVLGAVIGSVIAAATNRRVRPLLDGAGGMAGVFIGIVSWVSTVKADGTAGDDVISRSLQSIGIPPALLFDLFGWALGIALGRVIASLVGRALKAVQAAK
jgi:hypothetical protein